MVKFDQQGFLAYAAGKGYRCMRGGVFGVYGGYPFFAAFGGNVPGMLVVRMTVAGQLDRPLVDAIRQEVPKGCAVNFDQKAGTVAVTCSGKDMTANECFPRVLEVTAAALRERGLHPAETCPFCGQVGCDALAFHNGSYVPVHQACVDTQSQTVAARAEENAVMGNYFTGFLGALLGGLVGVIPNVLAAVLLERVIAFLYALIPLGAYYGYKLCKGKMNKGALVCSIISSVINLFMVELVSQYIWICIDHGLVGVLEYLVAFVITVLEGELTGSLLQGALFMGLGLWISWGQISHTSSHEVQIATAVQATMHPWPCWESTPAQAVPTPAPAQAIPTPVQSVPTPVETPEKPDDHQ